MFSKNNNAKRHRALLALSLSAVLFGVMFTGCTKKEEKMTVWVCTEYQHISYVFDSTESKTITVDKNGNIQTCVSRKNNYTPDSASFTYEYDKQGFVTKMHEFNENDEKVSTAVYEYDSNRNLKKMDKGFPDWVITSYYRDANENLTEISISKDNDLEESYIYNYDASGRLIKYTEEQKKWYDDSYGYDSLGTTRTFEYDSDSRLLDEQRTYNFVEFCDTYHFQYNTDGTLAVQEKVYAGDFSSYIYNYDANGNLTEIHRVGGENAWTYTYEYDDNGNIICEESDRSKTTQSWQKLTLTQKQAKNIWVTGNAEYYKFPKDFEEEMCKKYDPLRNEQYHPLPY